MRWTFFILTLLIFSASFAQPVPRLKRIGDDLFEKRQYLEAIEFYDKIVGIDKNNYEAKFKLGQCYDLTLQYEKAKNTFLELSKEVSNPYRASSMYFYANQLKHEKQFELADSLYSELVSLPSASPDLIQLAKKHQAGCQLGMRQEQVDRGFSVSLMNDQINSKFHDFGAAVNPKSGQLILSSTRPVSKSQYEGSQYDGLLPDLISHKYERNRWRTSTGDQKFDRMNSHWSEGSGSFRRDGNAFYFTSCKGEDGSDCSILVSYLINDEWTTPTPLNEYINEPGSENKHPYITPGDTLFFVSDRPGGQGASDIWMSLRGDLEDSWTPAINLGPVINSPEAEISPYYSSSFNCLLFASNGHVGYGGYDLYAAKGVSFFQPEIYNLGPPFNTSWDDTYFHITDSAGYLSSNRKDGRILNIYYFEVSEERLFLSLLISGESLIDSRIVSRFKDIRALDLITFRVEDYQGYNLFDPIKYDKPKPKLVVEGEAIAEKEREQNSSDNSSVTNQTSVASTYSSSNNSDPNGSNTMTTSGRYQSENPTAIRTAYETQYFDFGLYELQNESLRSLDLLAEKLQSSDYLSVVLLAYADNLGTDTYNLNLSQKRGLAIKNYLIQKGIPASKIRTVARGELRPEGKDHWFYRVLRRKVEVIVESEQLLTFDKADHFILRKDATIAEVAAELGVSIQSLNADNNFIQKNLKAGRIIRVNNHQEPREALLLDQADVSRIFLNDQVN